MGGRFSSTVVSAEDRQKSASDWLDDKLAEVIKKKAARNETKGSSFNKLLLRFDHLDKGFSKCRDVYRSLDIDGNSVIDLQELREGCKKLGFSVDDATVETIFNASDLDGNHVVDFREFIVVLAILYMLSTEDGGAPPAGLDADIIKTYSIAEEAFTYFDASRDGYMDRSEVMAALLETGIPHKKGTFAQPAKGSSMNRILLQRFEEMDWDNNGQISFKEFLYAVQSWVLDEDLDEAGEAPGGTDAERQEEQAAKAMAASRLNSLNDSQANRQNVRRGSLKR